MFIYSQRVIRIGIRRLPRCSQCWWSTELNASRSTSTCRRTQNSVSRTFFQSHSSSMLAEKETSTEMSKEQKSLAVCRLMGPEDANISGNVHGGVILKMIEQAGLIISTRHCNVMRKSVLNKDEEEQCVAALVRVEKTDFLQPMYIGEVAELHAEITHTAYRSMEVQVKLWAENILTGARRMTNNATLWYVPVSLKTAGKVLTIPKMSYKSPEMEAAGWERYYKQKEARQRQGLGRAMSMEDVARIRDSQNSTEEHTILYAQSSLIHLAGVTDCNSASFVNGGVTMKLMDDVAGITAFKHCKTEVVTASMDAVNLHQAIPRGSVMHVIGRPTFTSKRSIEIEVFVDMESMFEGQSKKQRAVHAFFTYVSLGKNNEVIPVPELKVRTDGEISRFQEGQARYEERKLARYKDKCPPSSTTCTSSGSAV